MNLTYALSTLRTKHPLIVASRFSYWRWTPLLERICEKFADEGVPILQVGECEPKQDDFEILNSRYPGIHRINLPTLSNWRRNPWSYLRSHQKFRKCLLDIIDLTAPRALIFEGVDLCFSIFDISRKRPDLSLVYWGTELSCAPRQSPFRYYKKKLAPRLTGMVMNHQGRVKVVKSRTGFDIPSLVIPNTESCPAISRVFSRQPLREMFAEHNQDVKIIIFYAGIVSHKQCIHDVVKVLPHLPDHIGFAFSRRVGNQEYMRKIACTIERYGLQKRVIHPRWVSFDKVPELAASADIGLVLLRENDLNTKYCASSKLYRYMAVGLPMIGSILPSISNILEMENIGVTCDVDSAESIIAAINKLKDEVFRDRLSRNSIEAFDNRYCLEVQWAEHRDTLMHWTAGKQE